MSGDTERDVAPDAPAGDDSPPAASAPAPPAQDSVSLDDIDPDAPYYLDRIGTVRRTGEGETATVLVAGVPEAASRRLAEAGDYRLLYELEQADEADVAVVSTRAPRGELGPLMAALRSQASCPIVALVHTGGEALAVDVLRAGGVGVVAEGNEGALRSFLSNQPHDQSMVDTYDRQVGSGARDAQRGRDPATGLPGRSIFEQRVDDLVTSGEIPRVAYVRVVNLDAVADRISPEAQTLMRRRIAVQFQQLCRPLDVELYAIDATDFAVIGLDLSPNRSEQLGRAMNRVAETYTPAGTRPLSAAMGHAGAETSLDLAPLQEIAKRALEVAVTDRESMVIGAEQLAMGVSSTTELEAARRAVGRVEKHDPYPAGHGERVAEIAGEIAWQLGFEGQARTRIMLAGLLHDVGKIALPDDCVAGPDGLDLEHLEAYRTHAERGAEYLRVSAGDEVADAVAAHHEHWDGSGFPQGLVGEEIPIGARVVRLADTVERLRHGVGGEGPLRGAALLDALDARAGTELDPDIVSVARPVIDKLLSGPSS